MIIDTHTHIYSEEFDLDCDEMLQRARLAGISRMIMPATDRACFSEMMRLARLSPERLFATIGLHPTYVKEDWQDELAFVRSQLESDYPFVAIGEIGLDYYWDTTYQAEQIEAFETQLRWAEEYGSLPVIVHTRSSFADTFASISKVSRQTRGVFHSFTGSEEELEQALGFEGMMIGVNGVVTFKNSELKHYLTRIPLDRLLLETDAPYLAPVPKRGKRNEPAFIAHTLEFVAGLYQVSASELASITSANAERLFPRIGHSQDQGSI